MAIELNELETKELNKLMRKGLSKGEALVKMGKATLRVEKIEKDTPKVKSKRVVKVDETKEFIIEYVRASLNNLLNKDMENIKMTALLVDGTKKIDFTINGESYTLALTKHKAIKK